MKIIAFGNKRYKRVAHNWALYLQRHGIENYTIYSLDQEIYDYLVENKINTEYLPGWEGNFYCKWRERLNFTFELLNEGTSVLHSDLDAVWLKNPLGLLEDYDIVAGTGKFPGITYEKIGFTLCMGWIYFKPSTIVKELLQNTLDRTPPKVFDDQREFNRELFDNKLKYEKLKLKVLDPTIVSRHKRHNNTTYIAHPCSQKDISREKFFKRINLWILK
jgi:hypothetical protein